MLFFSFQFFLSFRNPPLSPENVPDGEWLCPRCYNVKTMSDEDLEFLVSYMPKKKKNGSRNRTQPTAASEEELTARAETGGTDSCGTDSSKKTRSNTSSLGSKGVETTEPFLYENNFTEDIRNAFAALHLCQRLMNPKAFKLNKADTEGNIFFEPRKEVIVAKDWNTAAYYKNSSYNVIIDQGPSNPGRKNSALHNYVRVETNAVSSHLGPKKFSSFLQLCNICRKSCRIAPLIKCDFCSLTFHGDCLDPPMIKLPGPFEPWMCPVHPEHLLAKKFLPPEAPYSERMKLWDFHAIDVEGEERIKRCFIEKTCSSRQRELRQIVPVASVSVPSSIKMSYVKRPFLFNQTVFGFEKQNKTDSKEIPSEQAVNDSGLMKNVSDIKTEDVDLIENDIEELNFAAGLMKDVSEQTVDDDELTENDPKDSHVDGLMKDVSDETVVDVEMMENVPEEFNVIGLVKDISELTVDDVAMMKNDPEGVDNVVFVANDLDSSNEVSLEHNRLPSFGVETGDQQNSHSFSVLNEDHGPDENLVQAQGLSFIDADKLNMQFPESLEESPNENVNDGNFTHYLKIGPSSSFAVVDGATTWTADATTECDLDGPKSDVEVTNDFSSLEMIDPQVIKLLAYQRLQQLNIDPRVLEPLSALNVINTVKCDEHYGSMIIKSRASLFCLNNRSQQPSTIPMPYRKLTIGTDGESNLVLSMYGQCNFFSGKHAVIYFDELERQFELINYSDHGTVVDNVLYSLDLSEKKARSRKKYNSIEDVAIAELKGIFKKKKKVQEPEPAKTTRSRRFLRKDYVFDDQSYRVNRRSQNDLFDIENAMQGDSSKGKKQTKNKKNSNPEPPSTITNVKKRKAKSQPKTSKKLKVPVSKKVTVPKKGKATKTSKNVKSVPANESVACDDLPEACDTNKPQVDADCQSPLDKTVPDQTDPQKGDDANVAKMKSRLDEKWTVCECVGNVVPPSYDSIDGWEGCALLHHGSVIQIGCLKFVFSITAMGKAVATQSSHIDHPTDNGFQ